MKTQEIYQLVSGDYLKYYVSPKHYVLGVVKIGINELIFHRLSLETVGWPEEWVIRKFEFQKYTKITRDEFFLLMMEK